ncbi:MAG: 6,7-dimethyl-8-ribityllumazine synthase [Bdellovibrionales bacterium]|nr:6,7-dimethyl-8-ribityllumazine synthase [Bdellovibrionales bacterium]
MTICIVKSEFNKDLVEQLYQSALKELKKRVQGPKFFSLSVPGACEIPQAINLILDQKQADAVLALGVIIRGKTAHFNFLQNFLQIALWDLQKTYFVPIVFSVLLLEKRDQFQDRILRAKQGVGAILKMLDFNAFYQKNRKGIKK